MVLPAFKFCSLIMPLFSGAALIGIALAVRPAPALADDYAGCVDGFKRYNQNIENFKSAESLARIPICQAMAPEKGYAACQQFIKSGTASQPQIDWATSVSSRLAGVYRTCLSQ